MHNAGLLPSEDRRLGSSERAGHRPPVPGFEAGGHKGDWQQGPKPERVRQQAKRTPEGGMQPGVPPGCGDGRDKTEEEDEPDDDGNDANREGEGPGKEITLVQDDIRDYIDVLFTTLGRLIT